MIEWKSTNGGVAQSGEHLLCKQGVRGSNPLTSTMLIANRPVSLQRVMRVACVSPYLFGIRERQGTFRS